jgi:hypothetical protein
MGSPSARDISGWSLNGLFVAYASYLKPRFTYLEVSGWGWVDFKREINAINR